MTSECFVEVSACANTVWVHASDGSTVGRFSKHFGMDIHRSIGQQLEGQGQCLHCTHEKPSGADWAEFCELMMKHFDVVVSPTLLTFGGVP